MKPNAMTRLERVAADVLQMMDGTDFAEAWPDTYAWAKEVQAAVKLPVHQNSRPALVLEVLNASDAKPSGYTVGELAEKTGMSGRECSNTLWILITRGLAWRMERDVAFKHSRSRYFGSLARMEAGRAHVDAEQAEALVEWQKRRREAQQRAQDNFKAKADRLRNAAPAAAPAPKPAPKAPKAPKPARPPKPARVAGAPRRPANSLPPLAQPPAPLPRRSVFEPEPIVPPGLQVQQLPSGRDTRFTIDPAQPIEGGFMDDWRRRRGGSS